MLIIKICRCLQGNIITKRKSKNSKRILDPTFETVLGKKSGKTWAKKWENLGKKVGKLGKKVGKLGQKKGETWAKNIFHYTLLTI